MALHLLASDACTSFSLRHGFGQLCYVVLPFNQAKIKRANPFNTSVRHSRKRVALHVHTSA